MSFGICSSLIGFFFSPDANLIEENEVYTSHGILTSDCDRYSGMTSEDAMKAIINDAEKEGYGRRALQVLS